ncbi:MAG: hypothetical protein R3B70_26810 [Polyangiaceae bacterium]
MISSVALLPACDGDGTGTGGGGSGGAGGSTGGAGGSTGGTGGTGGSTGGAGGTGGAAFTCTDYCAAIDPINDSLGCNPFDCSMTCPDALANFAAAGCSAEGEAAFSCIMKEPEASWGATPPTASSPTPAPSARPKCRR